MVSSVSFLLCILVCYIYLVQVGLFSLWLVSCGFILSWVPVDLWCLLFGLLFCRCLLFLWCRLVEFLFFFCVCFFFLCLFTFFNHLFGDFEGDTVTYLKYHERTPNYS